MTKKSLKIVLAASVSLPVIAVGAGTAAASGSDRDGNVQGASGLQVTTVLSGKNLTHTFTGPSGTTTDPLTKPDDITRLGNEVFVGFQNGVGPQGEPASDGNTASTIVGFSPDGKVLSQWDVTGKVDGLTADPGAGQLIATVNEDANSSVYVLDPSTGGVQHYTYNQNPLPHDGGTDAISIAGGRILISASAPGTASVANQNPPAAPQSKYPAVYSVSFDPETAVASVSPLFSDTATATAANGSTQGKQMTLGLTDPDSSEVVPQSSPRFAGDYVLDSQGDQQQIYARDPGGPGQQLSVLRLSQAIDDTAWTTSSQGALYATDSSADTVDAITGSFQPGTAYVAVTPCDAATASSTCSTDNYLGTLNMTSGTVNAVPLGSSFVPEGGMIFVGRGPGHGNDDGGGSQG